MPPPDPCNLCGCRMQRTHGARWCWRCDRSAGTNPASWLDLDATLLEGP